MINEYEKKRKEIIDAIEFGAFHRIELEENQTMFHYTSIEGFKGIIDSEVFKATEYHFLNDQDEFSYVDKLLLEIIDEELYEQNYYYILREAVIQKQNEYASLSEKLKDSYYVVSFSTKQDNLTLWAEFASYGCNMELDPIILLEELDNLAYHGYVYYERKKQKEILLESMCFILEELMDVPIQDSCSLRNYIDVFEEEDMPSVAEILVYIVKYYGMAMKDEVYEAEAEYRFIFRASCKDINFRAKDRLMIPYIELSLNLDNSFEALKSVTLAPLNGNEMCKYSIHKYLLEKCNNMCDIHNSKAKLRY